MFTFGRWIETWGDMLRDELPTFVTIAVVFLVAFFIEQRFAAEKRQTARGRFRNILLGAIYFVFGFFAFSAFATSVPVSLEASPDRGLGVSLLYCLGYLLAVDFLYYWYHRAQHSLTFLWAIHELHHADAELNITTSYRT
jgi:sterol desaturase/sphingolipid hydroxylase (fatty acid hydroxylase superfamily)